MKHQETKVSDRELLLWAISMGELPLIPEPGEPGYDRDIEEQCRNAAYHDRVFKGHAEVELAALKSAQEQD